MSHIESNRVKPVIEAGGDYFPPAGEGILPSGCTILDLVLGGGYPLGRFTNIVGDKSTGKTLLAIEAVANFHRKYPDAPICYNETEAAFDEDYARLLGIPIDGIDMVVDCDTIEGLFQNIMDFVKKVPDGGPALYIIDSFDALSDKAEMESEFDKGSYGMAKAKGASKMFRQLVRPLAEKNILLIVVSQVRANVGVTFGSQHTRSGGRALDFYASQVLWLAHKKRIEKQVRGVKMAVGVEVVAQAKKNKIGMPFRKCEFPILFGYGIDDAQASVDYLKSIKSLDKHFTVEERATLSRMNVVDNIVSTEIQNRLSDHVKREWQSIEASVRPARGKYA